MQLTLHATRRTPHGAPRLVQAMPAWQMKTRHAPSRHCKDARVYGHTTTAMPGIEYTSPIEYTPVSAPSSLPPPFFPALSRNRLKLYAGEGARGPSPPN